MSNLVVPIDVESLMITGLSAWLPTQGETVPVADELAAGEQVESVAIFRTGGVMSSMVTDSATVVIEANAADKARTYEIISLVRAWVHFLEYRELGGYGVCRVEEFAGPANLPVDSHPNRYTMTISVDVQAEIR